MFEAAQTYLVFTLIAKPRPGIDGELRRGKRQEEGTAINAIERTILKCPCGLAGNAGAAGRVSW